MATRAPSGRGGAASTSLTPTNADSDVPLDAQDHHGHRPTPRTLRRLAELGPVEMRQARATPDGDQRVDYLGPVDDPAVFAASFHTIPGVVSHGLSGPQLVTEVIIGRRNGATERWRKE